MNASGRAQTRLYLAIRTHRYLLNSKVGQPIIKGTVPQLVDKGINSDNIIKTLAVAIEGGDAGPGLVAALIRWDHRLKRRTLRQILHANSAELVDPDDLQKRTGFAAGSVTPFSPEFSVVAADDCVLNAEYVVVSAGPGRAYEMSPDILRSVLRRRNQTLVRGAIGKPQ